MKRMTVVFIAIIVAFAFSSCEKGQLGVYNPKKKIHKVYKLVDSEKQLAETWNWDNDKLKWVDIHVGDGFSATDIFEYDGNFMSKITRSVSVPPLVIPLVNETFLTYDGKKLVGINSKLNGVTIMDIALIYKGNKVSQMGITSPIFEEIDKAFPSLRYVLPAQIFDIAKETHKSMTKTSPVEYDAIVFLTWEKDNFVKAVTQSQTMEGVTEYSYDNMNNPFYGLVVGGSTNGFTKNNMTKLVSTQNNYPNSKYEQTYTYKYENNYPIEFTVEDSDDDTETTYYEYID